MAVIIIAVIMVVLLLLAFHCIQFVLDCSVLKHRHGLKHTHARKLRKRLTLTYAPHTLPYTHLPTGAADRVVAEV